LRNLLLQQSDMVSREFLTRVLNCKMTIYKYFIKFIRAITPFVVSLHSIIPILPTNSTFLSTTLYYTLQRNSVKNTKLEKDNGEKL